jgi:hypothetical protein
MTAIVRGKLKDGAWVDEQVLYKHRRSSSGR